MAVETRALNSGQKFALLVGFVILALGVLVALYQLGGGEVTVGCPEPSASPTASPSASAPAATPSPSPATTAKSGEGCLFGLTFTAGGTIAAFIVILLILLLVWNNLRIAVFKTLNVRTADWQS